MKNGKLFHKMLAAQIAVLLTAVMLMSAITSVAVQKFLYQQKWKELREIGQLVIPSTPTDGELVRRWRQLRPVLGARDIHVLQVDGRGRVLFPVGFRGNSVTISSDVRNRLMRGKVVEGRDRIGNQPVTWVIFPDRRQTDLRAWILFSPVEGINRAIRRIRAGLLLAASIALVVALVLSGWFTRGWVRRIEVLRRLTGEIRQGRYHARAEVESGPLELMELTRDLNAMAERLAEWEKEIRQFELRRQQFVSDVSHELRTPLTSIRGWLEGLESRMVTEEERMRAVASMKRETMRLIRLINELLDLEKIRSGTIELKQEQIPIAEVLEIVVEQLGPVAEEKGLRLEIDAPRDLMVIADYDRLMQILINLVKNGLQFTERGWVRVTADKTDGGTRICVEDTGIGMTEEQLARIWDRFFKADPSRSRQGGETGLGLAIVRQLVKAHGGQIRVDSTPGKGTCFTVWLPDGNGG
ncbi:HAMP domain-containing histidine kinase [Polycladomyces sp. WAk]|uniref:histidine kinase n=1 Tax=Polycladomyces zharkentensis TaxID=2807616 RepID=A0ABS2WHG9_9BACL|nr:HAMP domain-containing sensor histidine kinase [Polycladomyces sp. WAk]MBN2908956.1 HAMP domain-containing histidine kinase [Polycladomyces sp. WAk]